MILAAAAAQLAAAQRTKVNFDFGWRHFLGNPGGQCTTQYPVSYNNVQCDGLTNASEGAASAAACLDAACNRNADLYQWYVCAS